MALPAATIRAILNDWDAPMYDGSQDARRWLMEIEEKCQGYGIQVIQMTEVAVERTEGEVKTVLTAILEAKVAEAGVWPWADFKECVIRNEGKPNQMYQPRPWTPLTDCDRELQAKSEGSVSKIQQS